MSAGMDKIKKIVYVMMENRSLDNVLGWLTETPGYTTPFDGLKKNTYYNTRSKEDQTPVYAQPVSKNKITVPDPNCGESFHHVKDQILTDDGVAMSGFLQDYIKDLKGKGSDADPTQIMESYTPADLPVLNGLAANFAVSDRYFCSVPTHTRSNRAFAASGNSIGNYNNGTYSWADNSETEDGNKTEATFSLPTMWNLMVAQGKNSPEDWMIFHPDSLSLESCYTYTLFDQLQPPDYNQFFSPIGNFYDRCKANPTTLPSFSFIDTIDFVPPSDYHPNQNVACGEMILYSIYEALTQNKALWNETLLIINFDEHGGIYDHITPPSAIPPWQEPLHGVAAPDSKQYDFDYTQYGVRVPLILVSPYVPNASVFRAEGDIPLDHTSVIASILEWMIPGEKENWNLGSRVYQAPDFWHAVSLETPRQEVPIIKRPTPVIEYTRSEWNKEEDKLASIDEWSGWPKEWGNGPIDAITYYSDEEYYFIFKGDYYVRHKWNKPLDKGPVLIAQDWSGWPEEWGSGGLDAAVYYPNEKYFYLFKGDEYVRHEYKKKPDKGPVKIASDWSGWPEEWGTKPLDGITYYEDGDKKYFYLFQGEWYVRHNYKEAPNKGPVKIKEDWSGWSDTWGDGGVAGITYDTKHKYFYLFHSESVALDDLRLELSQMMFEAITAGKLSEDEREGLRKKHFSAQTTRDLYRSMWQLKRHVASRGNTLDRSRDSNR